MIQTLKSWKPKLSVKRENCKKRILLGSHGFSIVEALFAGSLLAIIATIFAGVIIYGEESTATGGHRIRAAFLAEEGLEAARNIRDEDFANLTDGNHGLMVSGGEWTFSGTQDATDIFTRVINISPSGLDNNTKTVTSTVTWQATPTRTAATTVTGYLTNWRSDAASSCRGGVLVYRDGSVAADRANYKIMDPNTCVFGSAQLMADVDTGSTNRNFRQMEIYASETRNEKVAISKHWDGTNTYMYAQVFNGSTWGNVQLLTSWATGAYLEAVNFSGTYLANGDFMTVYSDNTTTPKFRTWNGTSWSAQVATQNIAVIPNFIVARARPGTNEVMAAFFDQVLDTTTQYFNGGSYTTGNWTYHTPKHGFDALTASAQQADFVWSPSNPLKGALLYVDAVVAPNIEIKIWTADGSGGGSWTASAVSSDQFTGAEAVDVSARPNSVEFIGCSKDTPAKIVCFTSNGTPAWTDPTNQLITSATDSGTQKSFDTGFEASSGNTAIIVYSDQSATPKLKKFNASTNAWDASPTSLNALGGLLKTVRVIPNDESDDMMIVLADVNADVYTVVWDGSNNTVYTTPSGYAFSTHGITGSGSTEFWYDFAWDRF